MKDVHFTIELKDGIAITGDDQVKVREILYKMHEAFYEACKQHENNTLRHIWKQYDEWFWAIDEAIETINVSLKTEEE